MKILIITHTFAPALNGQAVFTTNLAEGLVGNKHRVRVLVPAVDRPAFEIRNGVEIQAISALDLRFIHKDLSLAITFNRQMDRLITDFHPDLIHLQDPSPISQSALNIAKKRNIPVLATHHPGPAIWAPYLPGENPIVKYIIVPLVWNYFIHYLNRADRISAPSSAAAKMLQNHGVKKDISPISCGVRLEEFIGSDSTQPALRNKFGLPPDKKIFVFIGRLDEEKKVDVLIKAMSFIKDNQVVLALAGNGLKYGKYHKLVATLGLDNRVIFLGPVQRKDIASLFGASDIFVMPGDVESLSISTLEALACGKPVIAANAMALPEMVQDGRNGYLFQPGNPIDLATKMDALAANRQVWPEMSKFSYLKVQDHQLSNTISTYEKLYQKMIGYQAPRKLAWYLFPIPGWISNYQLLFSIVEWAALVVILLISLIMRNQPVSAAPYEPVIQFNPEMVAAIKHFLHTIQQLDLPDNQANALQVIFQSLQILFSRL
jgi:glycosyltransferase involved in cell wall biosynthesis